MQDPADLLIAFEEASEVPIRPEYVEGMVIVPHRPDDAHNDGAAELCFQFRAAGFHWYLIDMISLVGEVTSTNHETDTGPKLRTRPSKRVPSWSRWSSRGNQRKQLSPLQVPNGEVISTSRVSRRGR